MVDALFGIWVPHRVAVLEVWADQTPIGIDLDGMGIYVKFLLMNPSLLFTLFNIVLMCGFQERLFAMAMPRCVATGTAMSVSSYIIYVLCMTFSVYGRPDEDMQFGRSCHR